MRLKMILPEDTKDMETDMEVFSLANIKSKQVLKLVMYKHFCLCNLESQPDALNLRALNNKILAKYLKCHFLLS